MASKHTVRSGPRWPLCPQWGPELMTALNRSGMNRPGGRAHRAIDLRLLDAGKAVGWLEDDFHHFGVTIEHDGRRITGLGMSARRFPWTTCAGADAPLRALIGKPLAGRASDIGSLIDMRLQCTHLFDLAGLLLAHITHAATRTSRRRYYSVVTDRERLSAAPDLSSFGAGEATLYQDGALAMHWRIDGEMITGPAPYGGHSQTHEFRAWTETMPEQEAEYATILRRAILVSGGRSIPQDVFPTAASMSRPAVCHSYNPGQRDRALRIVRATRDYSDHPQDLLLNVDDVP